MKSISAIIVIILVLMIVVALAALSYTFFMGIITSTTETTEEAIGRTSSGMLANMKIESMTTNNVYVRNVGQSSLTGFAVYINGEPADFNAPDTVEPGETVTVTITDFIKEGDDIEITTAEGITFNKIAPDPCDDAVLCLEMEEGSGETAYDTAGHSGHDGEFYDESYIDGELKDSNITNEDGDTPPKRVDGKFGKALEFDKVDDYVEIPDDDSLDFNVSDSFTIEMWVKANNITSDSQSYMIFNKYPGSAPDIRIYVRFGRFSAYIRDATGFVYVYNLFPEINTWYHLALVRDVNKGELFLYTDGNLLSNSNTTDTTTLPLINAEPIRLGAHESGSVVYSSWNGTIDELRIYRRALSQEEIQTNMQSSVPVASPVGSWSFEESGIFANDTRYWVRGKYGNALSFDGIDDYANISHSAGLNFSENDFTIEVWIKAEVGSRVNSPVVIAKQEINWNAGWGLGITSNGLLEFVIWNASDEMRLRSTDTFDDGIWHHVVVIRNNTTIRLYVDGEIIKELFGDALNGDSVYYLSIGASFIDGFYWHGIIDEVRIYKKAIY